VFGLELIEVRRHTLVLGVARPGLGDLLQDGLKGRVGAHLAAHVGVDLLKLGLGGLGDLVLHLGLEQRVGGEAAGLGLGVDERAQGELFGGLALGVVAALKVLDLHHHELLAEAGLDLGVADLPASPGGDDA
jgi:hypothetical protein